MNAPIKIQIDDATKRKADLWDALQAGEIGAHKHDALTRMATLGSEAAIAAAHTLESMSRWYGRWKHDAAIHNSAVLKEAASILRGEAGRGRDAVSDLENGGNAYIMPGDA